ncbi:hypothetical protein MKR65_07270 [Acinetobacter baumannii]
MSGWGSAFSLDHYYFKRYCYVKGGFAFSSDAFIDTGYPVIRIGDIKTDGSINLENCKYIPESLAVNSRDYLVEKINY